MQRGFHGASLDDIADAAGYTKGAVYSNFAGKDDLYLALLEAHYEGRVAAYAEMLLDEATFEQATRAVGRFMVDSDARDPDWLVKTTAGPRDAFSVSTMSSRATPASGLTAQSHRM